MKRMLLTLMAGAALFLVVGLGGAHSTKGQPVATLNISPASAPAGTIFDVTGCGYDPAAGDVVLRYEAAAGTLLAGATPGADGCFATQQQLGAAGDYTVTASQRSAHGHNKFDLLATATFTVM